MTLLVLTTEPPPLPGLPTTGAGLRAWGLTFGLRSAGHANVILGYAADSVRGVDSAKLRIPGVEPFERGELAAFIDRHNPSAVILQHWGLGASLPKLQCPLAVDLAGPHLLERALWGSRTPDRDRAEKVALLSRADYVVCSGVYQRHYFLPFLLEAGFPVTSDLCPVIPFSVSPSLPTPAKDRDLTSFVQSGFFLPWQDPSNALLGTLDALAEKQKGSLTVIGGPHPAGDVSRGQYDGLLKRLEEHPQATVQGVMPFDQLVGLLGNRGVALDLFARNLERELAYPTRTIVYLWAGLPVIHNNYDELAPIIEAHKCGWTVDPQDSEGLGRIIRRILSHPSDVQKRSDAARELIREQFTWDKTITPLAAWCGAPVFREGKPSMEHEVRLLGAALNREAAVDLADGREDQGVLPEERPLGAKRKRSSSLNGGRVTYSPPTPDNHPAYVQQAAAVLIAILGFFAALFLLVIFAGQEFMKRIVRR